MPYSPSRDTCSLFSSLPVSPFISSASIDPRFLAATANRRRETDGRRTDDGQTLSRSLDPVVAVATVLSGLGKGGRRRGRDGGCAVPRQQRRRARSPPRQSGSMMTPLPDLSIGRSLAFNSAMSVAANCLPSASAAPPPTFPSLYPCLSRIKFVTSQNKTKCKAVDCRLRGLTPAHFMFLISSHVFILPFSPLT